MLKRSQWPLLIVLGFSAFSVCVDVRSADAQGLFRRLQDRVETRLDSVAPTTPPAPAARPRAADPAAQRLSPINPNPAEGNPSGDAAPRAGSRFGGSILSRPPRNNPSAGGSQPNDAPKPSMGIQVVAATEGTPGLKVAGIRPGSLADEAGLQADDLILAVDGKATPNVESIAEILQQHQVGDTIRATVLRGETASIVVIPLLDPATIAEAMAAQANGKPATAQTSDQDLPANPGRGDASLESPKPIELGAVVKSKPGTRGVLVETILPDSSAAAAGLKAGDRIVSINGRLILDEATFQRELARYALGDELSINAVRDETLNTYDVVLQSGRPGQLDAVARWEAEPADLNKADSNLQDSEGPKSGQGKSVLGGLGSVLGGLFNGTPQKAGEAREEVDPLDLGDDEPIQRVGFDEEIKPDSQPLQADPPSVEELTPPAVPSQPDTLEPTSVDGANVPTGTQAGDQKDQIIQALRDEIRRLQERLNELEKGRS